MIVLLPFAAYLSAEELGVSGILAAVAAGMALNLKSASTDPGAQTRIASTHIWSMIEYVLNGVIFVMLRTAEHTTELQSLMRNSYAVFCLKKKKRPNKNKNE